MWKQLIETHYALLLSSVELPSDTPWVFAPNAPERHVYYKVTKRLSSRSNHDRSKGGKSGFYSNLRRLLRADVHFLFLSASLKYGHNKAFSCTENVVAATAKFLLGFVFFFAVIFSGFLWIYFESTAGERQKWGESGRVTHSSRQRGL